MAAGFVRLKAPRCALRRRVRQRGAVSRAEPGAAPRPARAACDAQAARRAVQFEPARRQRGGMEPRALRGVSRPGNMAAFHDRRRIRRAHALLQARRPAARAAALARERVARSALSYAPRCPIRPRNSSRVAAESRKVPTTDEVIMTEFCFSTPRIIMHRWRASIITDRKS